MIVGDVAQIDDEVLDIIHRGIAIFQQGADVLKQSAGLAHDVSFIDHISMLVDTGCTGDEVLLLELLASFWMESMVGSVSRVPRSKATPYSWAGFRCSSA